MSPHFNNLRRFAVGRIEEHDCRKPLSRDRGVASGDIDEAGGDGANKAGFAVGRGKLGWLTEEADERLEAGLVKAALGTRTRE